MKDWCRFLYNVITSFLTGLYLPTCKSSNIVICEHPTGTSEWILNTTVMQRKIITLILQILISDIEIKGLLRLHKNPFTELEAEIRSFEFRSSTYTTRPSFLSQVHLLSFVILGGDLHWAAFHGHRKSWLVVLWFLWWSWYTSVRSPDWKVITSRTFSAAHKALMRRSPFSILSSPF